MKKSFLGIVIICFFAAVMIMACDRNKGPAELAIKAAEEAVNTAKAEAEKFASDQVAELEGALVSAKDKMTKGDFKTALAEAQGLVGKAKEVIEAAKVKKDELTQKWGSLSQELPKMVEAIASRLDRLSKTKKLPAGMTAKKLKEAKSDLATAKEDWAKAQENFTSGNLADAISMADAVKEKAVNAMKTLGIPIPESTQS